MKSVPILFNDDELKLIRSSLDAVWSECAYDVLQAVADDKSNKRRTYTVNQVSIPRSHVVELALDAGRVEERMKHHALATPEFFARWEATSYEQKKRIARTVFTYATYGT